MWFQNFNYTPVIISIIKIMTNFKGETEKLAFPCLRGQKYK